MTQPNPEPTAAPSLTRVKRGNLCAGCGYALSALLAGLEAQLNGT